MEMTGLIVSGLLALFGSGLFVMVRADAEQLEVMKARAIRHEWRGHFNENARSE